MLYRTALVCGICKHLPDRFMTPPVRSASVDFTAVLFRSVKRWVWYAFVRKYASYAVWRKSLYAKIINSSHNFRRRFVYDRRTVFVVAYKIAVRITARSVFRPSRAVKTVMCGSVFISPPQPLFQSLFSEFSYGTPALRSVFILVLLSAAVVAAAVRFIIGRCFLLPRLLQQLVKFVGISGDHVADHSECRVLAFSQPFGALQLLE